MEVKERIQQKAHELFMKFGIRSVSMDDIANQIGVSKKTIYQFFADKDALVGDIIQEEVVRMEQECVYCSVNARDAVDEIFLTIEIILEQFKSFNPTLVFDLRKFHHQAYQKIEAHKREYLLGLIIRNLERGVEEGIYREDIKIPVIARFRLESMMLAFDTELFPPKQFDLADITRELIELFVYGVANEKGYQLIEKYKRDLQQKLNTHANK
ncbi:MAG: TetR/AcrR family transcriptional regulator [Chitinophagaceae bacterium]|nr:TetR/AcrR family transcriptional regulator [Chitinophagaceae bacterium]